MYHPEHQTSEELRKLGTLARIGKFGGWMAKKTLTRKRKKVLVTFIDDEVDLFERYLRRGAITPPVAQAARELAVEQLRHIFPAAAKRVAA